MILNLETSSACCSVAFSHCGEILGFEEVIENANHAAILTVLIDELAKRHQINLHSLDAIGLSAGPGSYTGLRIGAATAKGLCFALSKPLIAVDSLQALAYGLYLRHLSDEFFYCPTIDSRRNEIYYGIFGWEGIMLRPSTHLVLNPSFLDVELQKKRVLLGGNGVEKCRNILNSENLIYDTLTRPSARWMLKLSEKKLQDKIFCDPVSFEPNYIKPAYISQKHPAPF